jgi:hypothetical protein
MDKKIRAILIDPKRRIVKNLFVGAFTAYDLSCDLEKIIEFGLESNCGEIVPNISTDDLNIICDMEYYDFIILNNKIEIISIYNPNPKSSNSTPMFYYNNDKRIMYFKPVIVACEAVNYLEFDRRYESDCPLTLENIIENLEWGNWIEPEMKVFDRRPACLEDIIL